MVLPFVRTPPVWRPDPPSLAAASPPVSHTHEPESVLLAPPLAAGRTTPDRAEIKAGIEEIRSEQLQREIYVEEFRTKLKHRACGQLDELGDAVTSEVGRLTGDLESEEWAHLREAAALDARLAARESELESLLARARTASIEGRRFMPAHASQAEREIEGRLTAELEECRRARVLLRAAHPALAVFTSPPDLSRSNAALASKLWIDGQKFRTHLDDAKNRILTGDVPAHALDRVLQQTLSAEGIDPDGADSRSIAVREWLDGEASRARLIGLGSAAASIALGLAAAVLSGGGAIAAGVAGSVIGLGASVVDLELADDLHAISRVTITGEDGLVDPARARREYATAIAGAVLGVVDLGLAGKGLLRAGKSSAEALGTDAAKEFAVRLSASGWDAAALSERLGADGAAILGGLPVPQLARLRALLGADGLAHAVEVFGADEVRRFLDAAPSPQALQSLAEGVATPELREALKLAAAGDILACLRSGVSGTQLARTLAQAEKLHPKVQLPELLASYFSRVPPERLARELDFAEKALALEAVDEGHSVVRHGPQVIDELLDARVKTGVAADRVVAETRTSTRFSSFEAWYVTRERAMMVFREKFKLDFTKPPPASWSDAVGTAEQDARKLGESELEVSQMVRLDHVDLEPFGRGFSGTQTSKVPKKRRWTVTQPLSGAYRSQTTIAWRAPLDRPADGRWSVVQHFPNFADFDVVSGSYASPADEVIR